MRAIMEMWRYNNFLLFQHDFRKVFFRNGPVKISC